ncbi:hypothetical protein [Dawidia soli]|uniref:Uncharacterized protein n=1 Tax=Dawidia soli TaxID=2782352 RepID=A0AAP2D6Y7_9BACT|nr:hypothetical protein [Dawidia soli]MBT1685570.1 hypothetical protein [Dawidia soli]
MKYIVFLAVLTAAVFLTVATQVGGIIYLVSWIIYLLVRKRMAKRYWRIATRYAIFIGLYLITIFLVMPPIAKKYGRVPLPFTETHHVKPLTIWTALLNRNYVRPELRTITYAVGDEMNKKYPGTVVNYMDANFPFRNGYPLLPHISHNDGRKLDVAFLYTDKTTGRQSNDNPSPIGYGGSEPPHKGEPDRPSICAPQHWQYSFMYGWMPLSDHLEFDRARTQAMINAFINQQGINTLYLEPHLKKRLRLKSKKIRLHACYSVRHDDHVHVQL